MGNLFKAAIFAFAIAALTTSARAKQGFVLASGFHLPSEKVTINGKTFEAIETKMRILLCKQVAEKTGMAAHGIGWADLYGVIGAETSWIPDLEAMGNNGKASRGLAQLEDATSARIGVTDAYDPLQALTASANLLIEGADWSRRKKHPIHTGMSVYYNTRKSTREKWDGQTLTMLPIETQRHINNVALSKRDGLFLDRKFQQQDSRAAKSMMAYVPKRSPYLYKFTQRSCSRPVWRPILADF